MIDPFGNPKNKLNIKNLYIFSFFHQIIKPIQGYSLLNYLSWDSYILSHYSQLQKHVTYLGAIYMKYDRINKIFTYFHITPSYILSIIQIARKTNPSLKKIIFGLELELGSYNHTNLLVVNLVNKTINIFEPWGKHGRFKEARKYYNKVKIDCIRKLFKFFKNYRISDIAYENNIIGPQDNSECTKIKNLNTIPYNTLIVSNKFKDQNLFFQYSDANYIYVTNYPQKKPTIVRIKKSNPLYYPCGFDIHNGICDLYCLYFGLLIIVNPSQNEVTVNKYISKSSVNDIQIKIINLLQWIIQWYHYQITFVFNKNYKLSLKTNFTNYKKVLKTIDLAILNKYNRLSKLDKNLSEIISDNYCKKINLSKIYKWLQNHLSTKYNVDDKFIDYIIKNDSRLSNKCLLFLSVKNIYDIECK
tara:strand:+ start:403 stop:1647 length:1245 start_codon:yes stop_codon:yes gene_type:complete